MVGDDRGTIPLAAAGMLVATKHYDAFLSFTTRTIIIRFRLPGGGGEVVEVIRRTTPLPDMVPLIMPYRYCGF